MHQYDSNLTCVRYLYDLDETEAEPAQDGEAPKADDGLGKRNPTEIDKGGEVDNTFETGVFIVKISKEAKLLYVTIPPTFRYRVVVPEVKT